VHLGGLSLITGVFFGVSPAVIALILRSCWRLAKLGMEDRVQWAVAVASFLVTVVLQAEVALLFVAAGLIGIAWYGSLLRRPPPSLLATAGLGTGGSAPRHRLDAGEAVPVLPEGGLAHLRQWPRDRALPSGGAGARIWLAMSASS
jgi:chromate transport protein ChrA